MAELDRSVFDRPVAAFRVIPYFARRSLKLADLENLLDISEECLRAMEASRSQDKDTDDEDAENTDTSSVQSAEDDDAASATSD